MKALTAQRFILFEMREIGKTLLFAPTILAIIQEFQTSIFEYGYRVTDEKNKTISFHSIQMAFVLLFCWAINQALMDAAMAMSDTPTPHHAVKYEKTNIKNESFEFRRIMVANDGKTRVHNELLTRNHVHNENYSKS